MRAEAIERVIARLEPLPKWLTTADHSTLIRYLARSTLIWTYPDEALAEIAQVAESLMTYESFLTVALAHDDIVLVSIG